MCIVKFHHKIKQKREKNQEKKHKKNSAKNFAFIEPNKESRNIHKIFEILTLNAENFEKPGKGLK